MYDFFYLFDSSGGVLAVNSETTGNIPSNILSHNHQQKTHHISYYLTFTLELKALEKKVAYAEMDF